jgi:hypothetical protein
MVLQGSGVLYNASACYIATTELQVYAERNGEATLSVPEGPMVMADHKLGTLRELIPIDTTEIDQLTTRITIHRYGGDVNNLLQLHAANLQHRRKFNWILYALISLAAVIVIIVIYHFTSPYFIRLLSRCNSKAVANQRNDPLPNDVIPSTREAELNPISNPNMEPIGGAQESAQIRFTTYFFNGSRYDVISANVGYTPIFIVSKLGFYRVRRVLVNLPTRMEFLLVFLICQIASAICNVRSTSSLCQRFL